MFRIKFFLIFVLFLVNSLSFAQTHHHNTTVVMPSNVTYDNQVYEFSPSGFRSLIDENFKDSKPKFYKKLDKQVSDLESSNFYSNVVGWGGFGVGTLLAFSGLSSQGECDVDDTTCDDKLLNQMYLGYGIMLGGLLSYWILKPSREDYMKVINMHNKYNKKKPIDLKLGIAPIKDGAKLALNFRF